MDRLLLCFWVCVMTLVGCDGGCSKNTLAELTRANGEVTRDHASTKRDWKKASVGSRFGFGDAVRTSAKASARVLFDDGGGIELKEKTTIRFLDVPPKSGEHGLSVEAGSVTLEVGEAAMRLRTDVGLARIEAGTIMRIGKGAKGLRFFVEVGSARIETKGEPEKLVAGQGLEVSVGRAVIERFGDAEATAKNQPKEEEKDKEQGPPPDDSFEKDIKLTVANKGASSKPPGTRCWQRRSSGRLPTCWRTARSRMSCCSVSSWSGRSRTASR